MKLFQVCKDGGPNSPVTGLFFVEIKSLFSLVLLHFNGTREAYHSHAFNAATWILKGAFVENRLDGSKQVFQPSLKPKITTRSCFHQVEPLCDTWAISFRGPWVNTWREFIPATKRFLILTHGRKVVG